MGDGKSEKSAFRDAAYRVLVKADLDGADYDFIANRMEYLHKQHPIPAAPEDKAAPSFTEEEIDRVIEKIEREWHDNGYFGEVRDDHGLVYEVVNRLAESKKEAAPTTKVKPAVGMDDPQSGP